MSAKAVWRLEPDGVLSVEVNGCRLTVEATRPVGNEFRFLVYRANTTNSAPPLVGSGVHASATQAMEAAEKMASSFAVDTLREGV